MRHEAERGLLQIVQESEVKMKANQLKNGDGIEKFLKKIVANEYFAFYPKIRMCSVKGL